MNALDEFDDNPDEALRYPEHDVISTVDTELRRSGSIPIMSTTIPTIHRGHVLDVKPSDTHDAASMYYITFPSTSRWVTANVLRSSYKPSK